MQSFRVVTDLDECRDIWQCAVPTEVVTDVWELRACFQRHFQRPARFLVAENAEGLTGLLPLSYIEEADYYGYFPGETWRNTTWLEQNRICAVDEQTLAALLQRCPGRFHLRYLLQSDAGPHGEDNVDEVGYLFHPRAYDYDIENYFREFSHKSAKRLKREIEAFEALGVHYTYDDLADFDRLVELNISAFGSDSYFHDPRFREGFRSLMHLLEERGWLRMTSVTIGGELAAVDLGCVYRRAYVLLAGGTNGDYRGVAKLMNLHHMRRACLERFESVDFLCGDFSWKTLFHLTPRPLYFLADCQVSSCHSQAQVEGAMHVQ